MRRKWIGVVAMCLLVCGQVLAEDAEMKTFSGTVTGPADSPVAEAMVDLFFLTVDQSSMAYQVRSLGQTKSDAEGKFTFAVDTPNANGYAMYCCLAQKKGLSCGWGTIMDVSQARFDIKLTEPQKMIGFVQNPDGTPVPEAEVRLVFVAIPGEGEQFMFGIDPVEVFATKTCSDGRFEFDNLPEQASAEFLIKKAGKGTLCTLNASVDPGTGLTYKAGQTEIMLTLQDGFKLAGMVVTQDDQKPVRGVPVMAMDTKLPINIVHQPLESAEDGSFEFADLAPGNYKVAILDDDWIAEPKTISLSGDAEGTKLELTKGGVVEIKVVDTATEEPVSGAQVNLRCEENGQYQQAATDESGIAKKQLLPGTYRVSAYGQGYRSVNEAGTLVVENKKTATLTVKLGGQTKLTGLVQGPDGKPFAGAVVRMVPGSGPSGEGTTSDENGQFKMGWDPEQLTWAEGEFYLVASSDDADLAGVTLIGTDTEEAVIKLQKGIAITGKVLNADGKPISGARVSLFFRGSRFSSSFGKDTQTDAQGVYTFAALAPQQKYSVNISNAKGYGNGRQEIEADTSVTVEDIVLQTADQKLSGQVVDVDGKGLANVSLHCYGEGQPTLNGKTDNEGKFAFDAVCAGQISISANYRQGTDYLYGNVRTEGGAEDVTVVVTQQGGSQRYVPKTPPSLVGKPLPDLSACGAAIPADADSVLVYAWDLNQRPSRHFLKQLAAEAEWLKEKGVSVFLLNTVPADKATLDTWLAENEIHYPCGIMTDNAEETAFNMGIKSLPWLILTNAENNVIAEGFSVAELEEKLIKSPIDNG
jgi:hypothetical protein